MTAPTFSWPLGLGLALACAAVPALAQDPPARVGRIAWLSGPVSFAPAGAADWAQAPLNRPLVAGDRLWTDAGARDEAEFGSAIARMDAGTLLTVLGADERTTQLQVSQGRIDLHVRRLADGETVEVDTPNLAFVARQPGDYRLVVAPDGGTTDVTVLRGAGDVYGDGTSLALAPGQGYRFGGQDLNNYVLLQPLPPDDFDRWAFGRDQRYERAVARRYVPQGVVGAEDLDDYGSWRSVPDYGNVWVPDRAPRDWAPYHDGHWAWVDPWGWTWIDDQPYGYAVSHYGRWIRTPDTWAWVPAPAQARPVYAPALVAFVGAVLTIGGRSDPGVGWFPLAPHEPYRPPYHASPTYIRNVNVSNTVIRQTQIVNIVNNVNNVTNIRYVNRNVPGAMVAMPAQQFAQAAPTRRAALLLPPGVARAAPVLAAPRARPSPQSRAGTPPAGRLPPAPAMQRVAVARALPAGAFIHARPHRDARPGGPAPARPGAPLAAHGPVPPLRVLRPAIGKPVAPQPARGPVPGAGLAGRQFEQGSRPGMPPVPAGAQAMHGAPPLAGLAPAARGPAVALQPGRAGHGAPPPATRPDAMMAGQRAARPDHPAAAPAPAPGRPAAAPQALAGPVPGPGARGPQNAARHDMRGPTPPPHMPAQDARLAAQGGMAHTQALASGAMPRPGDQRGAAPQTAPQHTAPPTVHEAAVRAQAPQRIAAQAPHAPAPRPQPQPQAQPAAHAPHPQPASHEAPRPPAPHPQPAAHEAPHPPAPHPQPAAHEAPHPPAPHPQPAPHEAPHPSAPHPQPAAHEAPHPPAPHPQPAAHEAPHPQPHPAPPAPAHGPDKGADKGHKHGEQGGH
jgi:hypothetical protein